MMDLYKYLKSPCSSYAIPYWKEKELDKPKDIIVVHMDDIGGYDLDKYYVERFFRIINRDMNPKYIPDKEYKLLNIYDDKYIDNIIYTINNSYKDIIVTRRQILSWKEKKRFKPELWIGIKDRYGNIIGSIIGQIDKLSGEGSIEWLQIIPDHQGKGLGKKLINYLIGNMKDRCSFITVSGRYSHDKRIFNFYKSCGFKGNDIWYILNKR